MCDNLLWRAPLIPRHHFGSLFIIENANKWISGINLFLTAFIKRQVLSMLVGKFCFKIHVFEKNSAIYAF